VSVILVCYATKEYAMSQGDLVRSARAQGIERCLALSPSDLDPDFKRANARILSYRKGAGCWLWKPYIILRTLEGAADGDTVLYADSGAQLVSSPEPLARLCGANAGILLFQVHDRLNCEWTKQDCFHYMGCDSGQYYMQQQVHGAFQVYRKCERSVRFVKEYLRFCMDRRIVTDKPNQCGQDNQPQFRAHRHDQSVLSLLAARETLEIYRDPSQFGNRYKREDLRVEYEYLGIPNGYAATPYFNSPYPTIFDHHRSSRVRGFAKLRASLSGLKRRFLK
jgi:hypothetical protein